MSYTRCFSTLGTPELDVEQCLDFAQKHGFHAIEPRSLCGRIDLPALFTELYGTPAEMARRVAEHPVQIASLDTSLQLFTNTPEGRAEMLEFVPWAEALQVPYLRWFDGGHDAVAEIDAAVDTWNWWTELKAQNGWQAQIMIETHDALRDAEAIQLVIDRCPGIKILWDTHHTWRIGEEGPATTWAKIAPHVVHLHVKDSNPIAGPEHPFTMCLPGEGGFPIAELKEAITGQFTGNMSLEWERFWHPSFPPMEDALASMTKHGWW